VRACLKRGAWQIVYTQGMRGGCSASEEGMSQVSKADGRAPCARARRPPDPRRSWPRQTAGRALPAGVAQRAPARAVAGRAPLVSPVWRLRFCVWLGVGGSLVTFLLSPSLGVLC
jgi:hypothetical protein